MIIRFSIFARTNLGLHKITFLPLGFGAKTTKKYSERLINFATTEQFFVKLSEVSHN